MELEEMERSGLVRRLAKSAVAGVLEWSGGRSVVRAVSRSRQQGARVQILAWHRITADLRAASASYVPALFTSAETFARQIEWLASHFTLVSLGEAVEVLAGRRPARGDLCAVTFDDGYADFLELALPTLKKYSVPATLYVPTGYVGTGGLLLHDRMLRPLRVARERRIRVEQLEASPLVLSALSEALSTDPIEGLNHLLKTRPRSLCLALTETLERYLGLDPAALVAGARLLDWSELKEVQAAGISVGAHTIDHVCLPGEAAGEVERQVREARATLEAQLKVPVLDFAYPNGWWSRGSVRALLRAGYRSAATIEAQPNFPGESPYTLRRTCVWEGSSRGLMGFSRSLTACNLDGTLQLLGVASWTPGERLDAVGRPAPDCGPAAANPGTA